LVCIAIPASFVSSVIKDAAKKKVEAAIVISAGFKETGEKGAKIEKELAETCKKAGIRLLGPNVLGMICSKSQLNASFAASTTIEGDIAFLSQSGAFCTAMLDMSLEKKLGFSHFVSLGNKADIHELDLIDYWQKDDAVKVIGAYLEEISQGQELLQLVRESDKKKPLIVFKPGQSEEAKKAISSHTGSMAGSTQAFKTAIYQNGIIEATEINQMFYLMMGFSWATPPKGNRVAVVTNAGGPGIITTDELIAQGMQMAEISKETKKEIKKYLPPTASLDNPIDVIGDALAERYRVPIDILTKDKNVDAIVVVLTPQLITQIEETAKLIVSSAKLTDKPIFPVFLGGKYILNGLQRLYEKKIPSFRYISDAVGVLSTMYKYSKIQESLASAENRNSAVVLKHTSKGKYSKQMDKELEKGKETPSEELVENIAREVGLDLPDQLISRDLNEVLEFAEDKYPVVVKATTEAIAHKTDVDALFLNIKNPNDLEKIFHRLTKTIKRESKILKPEVLVQEQVSYREELIIGASRDGASDVYIHGTPGFGHLILFGKGGIYTEVYKDIESVLVPASKAQMKEALLKTKVSQILQGVRGRKKLSLDKVIKTIQAIQKMVVLYPQIKSLDLNPVVVTEKRAIALDIKIFIEN